LAHGGRIWLDVNSPGAAIHFTVPVAESPVAKLSVVAGRSSRG
jgi:hypothetical protein